MAEQPARQSSMQWDLAQERYPIRCRTNRISLAYGYRFTSIFQFLRNKQSRIYFRVHKSFVTEVSTLEDQIDWYEPFRCKYTMAALLNDARMAMRKHKIAWRQHWRGHLEQQSQKKKRAFSNPTFAKEDANLRTLLPSKETQIWHLWKETKCLIIIDNIDIGNFCARKINKNGPKERRARHFRKTRNLTHVQRIMCFTSFGSKLPPN